MAITHIDGYKGFSTRNYQKNKSFIVNDVEVVKEDLKNHIFTRRGERVRMSKFGTRIPDIQYQQLNDTTISIIQEDLTYVFNYDPRVELIAMQMVPIPDENAVMVFAELHFKYLNFNDQFDIKIEFDK